MSQKWGMWTPPAELKPDAVRPVVWMLDQNAEYRERFIRKGDLRVGILETLCRDLPGQTAESESALVRVSGATRTAVRKATGALQLEGAVSMKTSTANVRDHSVCLNGGV